ncbi:AAA family ATPase [Alicyclobacillus fastidiosus]|uniref:AAA family ATPase n=1 Tax=Alicyclobacillus fastidiosus TaxID=392011 RepID=A0ABY6ZME8_9BACL|nr:AAA family ATPase [Alicyclobacillus fastidiosus]WAH44059.1 AAA family ATPase [Alicyclobacillus fastidiosus]GMA60346.1 hypothetical protein GCM10025859_07860 [Alicyclobacillus fastidiosus]
MKISFVEIQNFRRLKQCRIEFSDETTLFVGANNSGKTSAMDALGKFLANRHFLFNDITLANHAVIKSIGDEWGSSDCQMPESIDRWEGILPTLDVWLEVEDREIQYISHIIPTLKWRTGLLGTRFLLQPKDISKLFLEYREAYNAARETESIGENSEMTLWPKDLCEFIEKKLSTSFVLKAYILDPDKAHQDVPQKTIFEMECFSQNPLDGLIQVDMIEAQRGLSDPEFSRTEERIGGSLSTQLRSYYDKHLDPEKTPTPEDLDILHAMERATSAFNKNLSDKFSSAIAELEGLGYPGVSNPKITITTKVSATEALKHDSAVQYTLNTKDANEMKLPEKYNGLGYQNLISIVFQLMRFRDDWMQEGKAQREETDGGQRRAPLHLVLLEEPEAHLHMQVQQVFIRKAYDVLRNHAFLRSHPNFATQLIVSTHSSHIAREVKFANLRYFKRLPESEQCKVGTSKIVNLSEVFGKDDDTERFVTRYLQTTHCDLFFADAAILVEGAAESMLVPHFIRNGYPQLNERYITILSISGKHSHRLKTLIEKLCLTTLVITDLDSVEPYGHHRAARPERSKNLISSNFAITDWLMNEKSLDKLLDIPFKDKAFEFDTPYRYSVRIAYQTPVSVTFNGQQDIEALSSTFEDCLIYTNLPVFYKDETGHGIIKKAHDVMVSSKTFAELHETLYDTLRNSQSDKKAEFALDLIYSFDPNEITIPPYIGEGLDWLQEQIIL